MFLLVPAYPGSPGQKAVKRLCQLVCVCLLAYLLYQNFYGIGKYSTVQYTSVSHSSLNFECARLGYGFLSIILVLEKCNLVP